MWFEHRNKILAAAGALAVVAVAVLGYLMLAGGSSSQQQAEQAWRNRTPEPVVTVAKGQQVAILPGTSTAPVQKIQAFGACKTALDAARDVMSDYPSGLALDATGSDRLNKAFAAMDDTGVCPTDIAANFRSKEMAVWNNLAVPVQAGERPVAGR